MSGARHRRKGDRLERELVARHKALGVHAERYPLSGASRFRFTALEKRLGEFDALILRRNNCDPLVVLLVLWRTWARLLKKVRQ